MAEYISRNDLLDAISVNIAEAHNERCSQLLEAILNAPSADVAEVVRCCTCKYSKAVGDIGCYCQNRKTPWFNDEFEVYMNLDGFCSYGTPKERGGEK